MRKLQCRYYVKSGTIAGGRSPPIGGLFSKAAQETAHNIVAESSNEINLSRIAECFRKGLIENDFNNMCIQR